MRSLSLIKSIILGVGIFLFLLIEASNIFKLSMTDTSRHYYSLAILLTCILGSCGTIRLWKKNKSLFCIVFVFIVGFVMLGRLTILTILDMMIIPIIIAGASENILRINRGVSYTIVLILFTINTAVTYFEYQTGINLFYFDMNDMMRFRSTGIWGHPLYSAVIEASTIYFILYSSLNKWLKLFIWVTGILAIFMYDARAATIAVIIFSSIYLYKEGVIKKRNLFSLAVIFIVLYYVYTYLSTTDLGGKMFSSGSNDSKVNSDGLEYRITAIRIFLELDLKSMMMGVKDQFAYANKYNVICAENGFVARVLCYGLPIALVSFYVNLATLWHSIRTEEKNIKYIIVCFLIIAAITNQSLLTGYIWYTFMLLYLLLKDNENLI